MLNPVAMSIIRNVFEDPRERAQAIGIWGAIVGISLALGPVVGGALVDTAGWRWVFLVNVPVGVIALVLTTLYVPESRAAHARALDPVGQTARDRRAGVAYLRDHRGSLARLDLGADHRGCSRSRRRRSSALVRYERRARGAAAGGPLLPPRTVLRRQRDRRARVRRARRLPVPEHAVPAAGPAPVAVPGGAVHAADGRDDADLRAVVRDGSSGGAVARCR